MRSGRVLAAPDRHLPNRTDQLRDMTESIITKKLSGVPPLACAFTHSERRMPCLSYPDVRL